MHALYVGQNTMKRWIIALLIILIGGGGAALYLHQRFDRHHTAYRRAWKDSAIEEIRKDIANPKHFIERFGADPSPRDFFNTSGEESWHTEGTIICADGSWLIFRNRCNKEDEKIHDIFIAYASDKNWYYSDDHFCIGALVVSMRGQSESLPDFRRDFHLEQFDGVSDKALDPTAK